MKKISIIIMIVMIIQIFSSTVYGSNDTTQTGNSKETSVEQTSNESMTTADTRTTVWATTNKATNLVSAPYDNISTVIASLPSGSGFYIIERDYAYFYVTYLVDGKYRQGYVKMADVNYSSYSWVNHNIFEKGVTNFSSSSQAVLSGPGTTNSYESIGSIYPGENPLLILKTKVNTYNNVTYALIQYMVSSTGKFKRGWVPYSSLKVDTPKSDTDYIDENDIFYLESVATSKMIQAVAASNNQYVTQQSSNISSTNQMFKIEKASTGYYRFILQSNTNLSLQVLGNQMAEGSQLGVATKGSTGSPSKAEEFEVTIKDDGSFSLASRCTGRYRSVDLYGGNSANGTNIISSKTTNASNQKWRFQPKIIGGNDISIIKVGDSSGRACVSMYNTFGTNKLNVYYANDENLLNSNNVSKNTNFNLSHVKFAIKNSSVFYINGHGYSDPYIKGQTSYNITPSNIGFSTTDRARWGILSPCNQLNKDGSAVVWANYALKKGVRGILGYYDLAPVDNLTNNSAQPDNIETFTTYLCANSTYTFPNSWYLANSTSLTSYDAHWAMIYHASAAQDKLSNYNTPISNPTTSTIYYASKEYSAAPLSLSSSVNMNSFIQENITVSNQCLKLTKDKKLTVQTDGCLLYQKESANILSSDATIYTKEQVTNIIADFLLNEGISYNDNINFSWGEIKRSVLSDDGTRFENEETIAYTVLILPEDKNDGKGIYFEVTNEGVIRCQSDIKQ